MNGSVARKVERYRRSGRSGIRLLLLGATLGFGTLASIVDPVGPAAPAGLGVFDESELRNALSGELAGPSLPRDRRPSLLRGAPPPTDSDGLAGGASGASVPPPSLVASPESGALPKWDRRIALLQAAAEQDGLSTRMEMVSKNLARLRRNADDELQRGDRSAFAKTLKAMDAEYARIQTVPR